MFSIINKIKSYANKYLKKNYIYCLRAYPEIDWTLNCPKVWFGLFTEGSLTSFFFGIS